LRFGDYLGIGAGAHGKLTLAAKGRILRRWKVRHPTGYLRKAGTSAALGGDEYIAIERLPFDFMLNTLRLNLGFSLSMFESRTGLPRHAIADELEIARNRGWLTLQGDHIAPTELGRRFANDVITLFLKD